MEVSHCWKEAAPQEIKIKGCSLSYGNRTEDIWECCYLMICKAKISLLQWQKEVDKKINKEKNL